ncbi:MAG: DUF3291 domain-containing protein [Blastochloris sp.]|nr:DUF3291 domain-containing protein [Blastochloris sp.]
MASTEAATYHIAQLNIGRILAPLTHEQMAGFTNNLERINALADSTPGFVWRLIGDGTDDATGLRPFDDDDTLLVNMSVWDSIEALYQYTYYSAHAEIYRGRAAWFEKLATPILVLWWVPAGHIPTVAEAIEKLRYLEAHGPTPDAFTFKQRFVPPTGVPLTGVPPTDSIEARARTHRHSLTLCEGRALFIIRGWTKRTNQDTPHANSQDRLYQLSTHQQLHRARRFPEPHHTRL